MYQTTTDDQAAAARRADRLTALRNTDKPDLINRLMKRNAELRIADEYIVMLEEIIVRLQGEHTADLTHVRLMQGRVDEMRSILFARTGHVVTDERLDRRSA